MTPTHNAPDDAASAHRIAAAVQRETARHRRAARLYGLLVLIPLVLGVAFLVLGRTDRQMVQQEVDARVAPVETTYEAIRPALSVVRGLDTILPEVQKAGARLAHQDSQIADLSLIQRSLAQRLAPLDAQVYAYDTGWASIREAIRALPRIQDQLNRQEGLMNQLGARLQGVDASLAQIQQIQTMVSRLRDQVAGQDRVIRMLGDPAVLMRRLDSLDRRVDSLRGVRRLTPRPPIP